MTALIATILAALWGGLVLVLAWAYRPLPRRLDELLAAVRAAGSSAAFAPNEQMQPQPQQQPLEAVGRALRRLTRRRPSDDRAADRRLGVATVAALPALAVVPAVAPLVAAAAWAWPAVAIQRKERRRQQEAAAAMAEIVDLFALAVAAGLTVPLAVAAVARRTDGVVGAGLRHVTEQVALGRRTADALDDLAADLEPVRPLTSALAASERYGIVLGPGLQRLAAEVRTDRRRRAEEAARRVPVKLLFPLVLCTLPAFALLTVAPLIAGALESLRL